ncbi:PhoD-like phosphatase [Rubripirellula tenax]|uniref:PhoD-like phosphatase n=1 Tax=Rubripirellula tenax TaxID=2528015 RepID=A0A5C6EFF6_9BACT|nr:alkaline phosphatase D family protein [Rubripirellula tenax]TWU46326.1 PhoD-like phosphatase [Rubripirellula tenax]
MRRVIPKAMFAFALASLHVSVDAQTSRWPDPIASDVLPYGASGLSHGPLLGNPTSQSVRIWVRTHEPGSFRVRYGKSLPPDDRWKTVQGRTRDDHDRTGVVQIESLDANTAYFYLVEVNGKVADLRSDFADPWPSFRTLPDASTCADPANNPHGLFNLTYAIGHCASQAPNNSGGQYENTPAYDSIRHRHADEVSFGIVNGDVIYEEMRDGTIGGVRDNYKLYFSRGRSFANLFRRLPAMFTFDDHDVGWDIHGCGQVGLGEGRHLIRDIGLKAYEDYLGWANPNGRQRGNIRLGRGEVKRGDNVLHDADANFTSLSPAQVSTIHLGNYTRGEKIVPRRDDAPKNAGVYGLKRIIDATHLEFTPPAKASEQLDYSIGTHHYYDWRVGNSHFFALDTRGERSDRNAKDRSDPNLFILGDTQKKWLLDGIDNTDADFVFLISPDPWTIYHTAAHVGGDDTDDKGDGFPSFLHQRQELLDRLDAVEQTVIIFTGDVHASASVKISDNVWEMMCGPLGSTGHPIGTLGNPPNGGNWRSMDREVEIRWLSEFPNNMPYQEIRNTYYGIVQINNILQTGSPGGGYQFVAYDRPHVIIRWHDGYTGRLVYSETIHAR